MILPARNLELFPLATRSFHDLHLCKLRNVPESGSCIGHISEVKEYKDSCGEGVPYTDITNATILRYYKLNMLI